MSQSKLSGDVKTTEESTMKIRNPILMTMFAALIAIGCESQEPSTGEDEFLDSVGEALFAVDDDQFALEAEANDEQAEDPKEGICSRVGGEKLGPPGNTAGGSR